MNKSEKVDLYIFTRLSEFDILLLAKVAKHFRDKVIGLSFRPLFSLAGTNKRKFAVL